jgi:hypothetical protein
MILKFFYGYGKCSFQLLDADTYKEVAPAWFF